MNFDTFIPLPDGRLIVGISKPKGNHGWQAGDLFTFNGELYVFLGRDACAGLHARKKVDRSLRVFESSLEWHIAA